jgi:hypothetical protein
MTQSTEFVFGIYLTAQFQHRGANPTFFLLNHTVDAVILFQAKLGRTKESLYDKEIRVSRHTPDGHRLSFRPCRSPS